ncbi:ATPase inhibitor mai-2, mitochondrial-like isoform X2 [Haliotis rufescens]|uniref:ATPase inhibitor mai-2, mitochondrial-like isoform X2 n=2 Tax=Haliotis TaxID=6452 RepID=UPI001EAFFB95|nr:ATPase inhibitor mai-2, mitochondrial-like isoform X2 [Haliotis rufescens]
MHCLATSELLAPVLVTLDCNMAARRLPGTLRLFGVRYMSGEWGSGAGKGGGSGGSVRDAGGSFGKMEAAQEEQYFRKLQKVQLDKMKDMMEDEIKFHSKQMKMHQEAIDRHKKKISQLKDAGEK